MAEKIDTLFASPETWLLQMGYVSENSEQNLLLYGYLSSKGVVNVELMIDATRLEVSYAIVMNSASHRLYNFQRWLERRGGLTAKLALLYFIRVFGSYSPEARILRCLHDYAGKQWKAKVEVVDARTYSKAISSDRAKGWFFKDGVEQDRAPRQDQGQGSAPTAGR